MDVVGDGFRVGAAFLDHGQLAETSCNFREGILCGVPAFDLQQASKCLILLHLLQVAFYALHLISLTSLLGFLTWQRSSLLSPRCPGSYQGM